VSAPRLTSLDGLRGLASLAVVFWHMSLVFPQVINLNPAAPVGSATWWFEFTPLKLVSAGPEAVLIFFVLSGMVVVLPVLRRAEFDWISYYPRRIVRLYLPILASIAFAVLLVLLHPQVLGDRFNYWVGGSSTPALTPEIVAKSLDVFAVGNALNNPLWSLRWEFIFSLALPLFAAAAVVTKSRWAWGMAASVVVVWFGYFTQTEAFMFLPVFYAGALLAVHADSLSAWSHTTMRRPAVAHGMWLALLLDAASIHLGPAVHDLPDDGGLIHRRCRDRGGVLPLVSRRARPVDRSGPMARTRVVQPVSRARADSDLLREHLRPQPRAAHRRNHAAHGIDRRGTVHPLRRGPGAHALEEGGPNGRRSLPSDAPVDRREIKPFHASMRLRASSTIFLSRVRTTRRSQ
jgi:hypothetical protein